MKFLVAASWLVMVASCKQTPPNETKPTPAAASPAVKTPGCIAWEQKLAECKITPEAAGLRVPCDERVGACIAGQGCEAIRKKETGCVFE